MLRRPTARVVLGLAAVLLPLTGAQITVATAANAAPAVVTLHYNASGVTHYSAEATQAAQNWNNLTHNVKLAAGGNATITLKEINGGGSYTQTDGHGNGTIYIDRQQVAQGFDPTRILTHEFGHNLGLDDDYTGPCSEIMSGHGPGTSCKNAIPDAKEVAAVDQNFANGLVTARAEHISR
jgi:snapalysin